LETFQKRLDLNPLLSDGSGYDTSFGTDGKYINQVSGSNFPEDDILDAVILSDGKIGIAGRSYSGQRDNIVVGRLTARIFLSHVLMEMEMR